MKQNNGRWRLREDLHGERGGDHLVESYLLFRGEVADLSRQRIGNR